MAGRNIYLLLTTFLSNGDVEVHDQYNSFTEASKFIPDAIKKVIGPINDDAILYLDRNCTVENAIHKLNRNHKYIVKSGNNRTEIFSAVCGGIFQSAVVKLMYVLTVIEIVSPIEIPIAPPPPPPGYFAKSQPHTITRPLIKKPVLLERQNSTLCQNELANAIKSHQKRRLQKTQSFRLRLPKYPADDLYDIIEEYTIASKVKLQ